MDWRDRHENGYRVVWDIGWWLECATYQEAYGVYRALEPLPAFQDELFRPRIIPIRDGELLLDAVFPWPVSGRDASALA